MEGVGDMLYRLLASGSLSPARTGAEPTTDIATASESVVVSDPKPAGWDAPGKAYGAATDPDSSQDWEPELVPV